MTAVYLLINSSVEITGDLAYYDIYIIDASAGDIDITLPPDDNGATRIFYRIDNSANAVMFHPDGNDTIEANIFKYLPPRSYTQMIKIVDSWLMPIVSFT